MISQHNGHPVPGSKPHPSLGELSDEALVGHARTADVAAFEELVGRYEERLYRLAMRFVRNENDAKEILQESFLLAWRKVARLRGARAVQQTGCIG